MFQPNPSSTDYPDQTETRRDCVVRGSPVVDQAQHTHPVVSHGEGSARGKPFQAGMPVSRCPVPPASAMRWPRSCRRKTRRPQRPPARGGPAGPRRWPPCGGLLAPRERPAEAPSARTIAARVRPKDAQHDYSLPGESRGEQVIPADPGTAVRFLTCLPCQLRRSVPLHRGGSAPAEIRFAAG